MNFLPASIKNLPLKQKLLLSFMSTNIVSLVLACLFFAINYYLSERENLLNEATALADTIANASTASLVFDDKQGANEILRALKAHPNIDMAALYRKDGSEIAFYLRKGAIINRPDILPEALNRQALNLYSIDTLRPIVFEKELIGRIYLRYSLSSMASRQFHFLSLILLILIFASAVAYLFASRLMKFISKPIQHLADVARSISLNQDYSIRAEPCTTDEIGVLSDSLNNMLAQIQGRDRQLVQHKEQLEEQVAKRTHELEKANAQLTVEIAERTKADQDRNMMEDELLKSRKLESIGVLAGGIAHDFNNILTSVVGFISIARNRTRDNHKVQDFLINAEKGCFRAKNLTQQLLTFSRGGKPIRRVTSLVSVINDSIDLSMAGSNVLCTAVISDQLYPADIDAGQIGQALNNLLLNACQSMPNGGTINIKADNIDLNSFSGIPVKPGKYIKIAVEDIGCGIEKDNIHRIFDPYFSTKPMGNGLGLATCYSIIKNHGGIILVSSEQGKGTAFTVYLPAAKKRSPCELLAAENIETTTSPETGMKGRVLVMDDEEMIRNVADEMFTILGYSVSVARDGAEAITMYRDATEDGNQYTLTILDMTIPGGMGGVETIENLLRYDRNACVIVSSGYSNEPAMSDYRSYGFRGVITKPYTLDDLKAMLKLI